MGRHYFIAQSSALNLKRSLFSYQLYEDQPQFRDICAHLVSKGYEFVDFVNICRWERDGFAVLGQAVFGDGLFLRSLMYLPNYLAVFR